MGFPYPRRPVAVFAAIAFVLGIEGRPSLIPPMQKARAEGRSESMFAGAAFATLAVSSKFDPRLAYPAEVLRVIDGDTFQARVRVWPGFDVDTKIRLRDIDAPELHARCAYEYAKAQAARAALETILAEGGVTISRVGLDKYAGRVDALVATRHTANVSAALLGGGFARSYAGGRRGSWC